MIGFACLVYQRPKAWSDADDTRHLPQVVDIQIAPDSRGQGCGTHLIRALEAFALEDGHTEIFLSVDPTGNPGAYALYRRLGYRALQDEPYLTHWAFVDSDGVRHEGDDWTVDMVKNLGGHTDP